MLNSVKTRGLALLATVALLGGTAWIASGTTGAYFSDTHTGSIAGTIGSIQVHVDGGSSTTAPRLTFDKMLPGVSQTVQVSYKNTGVNHQDVWIVFNNATALSALNNLGTYGQASLSANGVGLFQSSNLSDNQLRCGTFGHGFAADGTTLLCWPLLAQYKVASDVAPGAGGSVSFSFNYASKMSVPPAAFNTFPASLTAYDPAHPNKDDQFTINTSDGSGTGLPYQIVATQTGIKPNAKG